MNTRAPLSVGQKLNFLYHSLFTGEIITFVRIFSQGTAHGMHFRYCTFFLFVFI
jgi:hypothetical protein